MLVGAFLFGDHHVLALSKLCLFKYDTYNVVDYALKTRVSWWEGYGGEKGEKVRRGEKTAKRGE